ncbi:MAG: hypothetical protein AAFZ49_03020 [Cyanobacteria bacterium J06659_2]
MRDLLLSIIQRIASSDGSEADFEALRQALCSDEGRSLLQEGKYNVHIGEGQDIHVGDRIYNISEINNELIRAIAVEIQRQFREVDRQSLERLDFQVYLRSLVETYQEWWQRYTLTEAIGRSQQKEEKTERDRPVFDFGLMVQTVQKETETSEFQQEGEAEKEKIERLPVLEGIHKYADDHAGLIHCKKRKICSTWLASSRRAAVSEVSPFSRSKLIVMERNSEALSKAFESRP